MKVQISDIDEEVWRRGRVAALGMGKTMGAFVELALRDLLYIVEDNGKTSPAPVSAPKQATVAPIIKSPGIPSACEICGASGLLALNRDRKWVCYKCAGV